MVINKKKSSIAFKTLICVLLVYVGGSLLGVFGGLSTESPNMKKVDFLLVISLCSLVFYFTIFVGVLMRQKWVRWVSLIFFFIQVPVISTPWIEYSLYLGAKFFTTVDINSREGFEGSIGLNVFALIALLLMALSKKDFLQISDDASHND